MRGTIEKGKKINKEKRNETVNSENYGQRKEAKATPPKKLRHQVGVGLTPSTKHATHLLLVNKPEPENVEAGKSNAKLLAEGWGRKGSKMPENTRGGKRWDRRYRLVDLTISKNWGGGEEV